MTKTIAIIAIAIAIFISPHSANAQQTATHYRIGFLHPGNPDSGGTIAFRKELRALGYVEGRDVTIDLRYAKSRKELLPGMTDELIRQKPDVIVVCCGPAIDAARKATSTIPIVVAIAGDWVDRGLAKSLSRPGGNITGLSPVYPGQYGKMLQLFKEAVPHLSRIAVLHIDYPIQRKYLEESQDAAKALGLTLVPVAITGPDDLPAAFRRIENANVDGLFVFRSGLLHRHKMRTTAFANKANLPSMFGHRQESEAGGLLAYGPDTDKLFVGAARYVDKILKGANPAELPINGPSEFDFVVKLKTAKALGITVPKSILFQATKVIE